MKESLSNVPAYSGASKGNREAAPKSKGERKVQRRFGDGPFDPPVLEGSDAGSSTLDAATSAVRCSVSDGRRKRPRD